MPTVRKYFAHAHIRTIVSLFGKLFSNVYHSHMNAEGTEIVKLSRVPIRYVPSSRSHFQNREPSDQDLNRFLDVYPRMTYSYSGLSYDSSRQVSMHQKNRNPEDKTQVGFSPAPYIISFDLRIYTRDNIKALEIIEQILPFFRPNLIVTIRDPAYRDQLHDVVVNLDSISPDDNFIDKEMRVVEHVLTFSVQTKFNGVVTNSDIEILKFDGEVDDGEGPIDDSPPLYEIVNGTIRRVIIDVLDLCVLESEDPNSPILFRTIIEGEEE